MKISILIYILPLCFVLVFNDCLAQDSVSCEITEEVGTLQQLPSRNKKSGYCFIWAMAGLLEHHYCDQTKQICTESKLSAADVIYQNKIILSKFGGGDISLLLQNPLKELASIDCAPDSLIKDPQFTLFSTGKLNSLDGINHESSCAKQPNNFPIVKTQVERITNILKNEAVEIARDMNISNSCIKKRLNIPNYKAKEINYNNNISNQILDILKKNKPVAINICQPTGMLSQSNCQYHATVIEKFRKKCCDGICTEQYKMEDSSDLKWISHEDGWVNADSILKTIEHFGRHIKDQTGRVPVSAIWLDEVKD